MLGFMTSVQAAFTISAQKLSQESAEVVIIDTRSPSDYATAHIEGAINFPLDWTFAEKSIDGTIVSPTKAQEILRRLGLNDRISVVIYDDGSMMGAARLFWTLEVYGLKHLQLLEKGYAGWTKLSLPTTNQVTTRAESDYIVQVNFKRIASKLTTLVATKDAKQTIMDARPSAHYLGELSAAKRFGHIPNAINIPADDNLQVDTDGGSVFLSSDRLSQVYENVPRNNRIILYCSFGLISSSNYLALRSLGYEVAQYDASWLEWGNDAQLPIIEPSKQVR
jgi:thiosulfate/3-mercaptopyruvate sulfurtransferase